MNNKTELHRKIYDDLHDTYRRKNSDYGDSFGKLHEKMPEQFVIRGFEKLYRLEELILSEKYEENKPQIMDALLDMANYAVMHLTEEKYMDMRKIAGPDDKWQIHHDICNGLHESFKEKQGKYGDSYGRVRNKFPGKFLIIRLNDKLCRLESLMMGKNEQKVNDENIDDTVKDIANCCILEIVEENLQKEKPGL